jgi:hypothetical protein
LDSKTLAVSATEKAAALEAALGSVAFSRADQLRQFLRYVCEKEIAGEGGAISEYVIGIEVFGRPEGYSILEDSTVRKRAYELRQKLERLYSGELAGAPIQIEIPKGSYAPRFVAVGEAAAMPEQRREVQSAAFQRPRRKPWRVYLAVGLGMTACVTIGVAVFWNLPKDEAEEFWAPALDSPSNVVICAGHPVVYRFSKEFQTHSGRTDFFQMQTSPLHLAPGQVLHGKDIVAIPNQYIGLGSAEAVADIHGWLARRKKNSTIQFGNDLTFTSFRNSPAVIIGAFNNKWMLEITKNLRFYFDPNEGKPLVRDRVEGKVWDLPGLQENGETNEDYVVISRLTSSPSGQFLVTAAGLTQYGGHTVGEVLTQPGFLREALRGVGRDWSKKNLQLLFHVNVIRGTAGPPQLVAAHVW